MKPTENDFVLKLLEVTETVESPEILIKWAANCAIATVLRDNVWLDFPARRSQIFPNLYVLIIADSGELRKSSPLKIVFSLVKKISNTKLIKGRASIQGILKELSKIEMLSNGYKLEGASALIYSEEFAASLVGDPQAIKILTDIYDFHEEHTIYLKSEDPVILKKVVTNLLTATNSSNLSSILSQVDMKGGFVGRSIIIIGDRPRTRNLGLEDSPRIDEWLWLEKKLGIMAKARGKITFSPQAMEFFNDWYQTADLTDSTGTGFEPRVHTHIMKLSIIKTASSGNLNGRNLIPNDAVIESMIDIFAIRYNYHKILTGAMVTGNNSVIATNHIMAILVKDMRREFEYGELLGRLLAITDVTTFESAVSTLKMSHMVDQTSRMGTSYIRCTKKMQDIYGGTWKEKFG